MYRLVSGPPKLSTGDVYGACAVVKPLAHGAGLIVDRDGRVGGVSSDHMHVFWLVRPTRE